MRWLYVWLAVLALTGCKDKQAAPPPSAEKNPAPARQTETAPTSPDTVLVEVDGAKFTQGEADRLVNAQFAGAGSQLPPEQMDGIRQQMLKNITDQFVARTLLLHEADRQKIEATPADEEAAYAKIRANLPEGKTLEEIMKTSPLGEEKMREEVRLGIRIEKLIGQSLTNQTAVSEEEITDFMANNQERMSLPEHVRASHILLTFKPDDADEAKAAKKAQLQKIREDIVKGADFADMARQHSDCPSKQKGGDLGTFTRGQMVKPFEEVAFSQATGTVSEIVETQFGYHLIKVVEHKQAGMASREDVTQALKGQKQQKLLRDLIDDLKSKADIKYPAGQPTAQTPE